MNGATPKVDGYLRKAKRFREELARLRKILLGLGLTEEIKWRTPCYTLGGKNVAFIGEFKEYCILSFVKGALLKDPKGLLVSPGPNTQSARMIRFTGLAQIESLESVIEGYLREAIENEKAGKKVALMKPTEFVVPEEFQKKMAELPALKTAFESLTPGRRRAYLMHFAQAKQSKTRVARIEKHLQRILDGKGLDD